MTKDDAWRPVRPLKTWPKFNPAPFDPRASVFIPALSVDNANIRTVSPRKVDLIGIKVYDAGSNNTGIVDSTTTSVNFDTVDLSQGFISPTAATFTTFTIPYDGVYLLTAGIEFAFTGVTTDCNLYLHVNSSDTVGDSARTNTIRNRRTISTTYQLTAGDTIGIRVRHEDAAAANRDLSAGVDNCYLGAIYMGTI
jgi:hypothetical protein